MQGFDRIADIGLIDLVVVILVVAAAVTGLRRGGLLAGLAGGAGTLLACWLLGLAVLAWGGPELGRSVERSAILGSVPVPQQAMDELGRLADGAWRDAGPGGPGAPTHPDARDGELR